jgi:uncharacterized membrane protein YdbT with pleckstrin-like domain
MEEEKIICEVSPSQILNLKAFLLSILAMAAIVAAAIYTKQSLAYAFLVIPVVYTVWKYFSLKSTRLKLTDQRIILSEGLLNKTTNETELYRVRDSSIDEPLFFRIFGCGNVSIFTTDEADSQLRFKGYKKPHWLKDQIRNYSEACRQKKRYGMDSIMIHEQIQNSAD